MHTADWIQAAVGFLALCGVIVAVCAVVLTNRHSKLLYEAGRFDLVVDCATEMTSLASRMRTEIMPLWAIPDGLYGQIMNYRELQSLDGGHDENSVFEVRLTLIDSTVNSLHDVIDRLTPLGSKLPILGWALPDRMRDRYLDKMVREAQFLSRAVMMMYLTLVPTNRAHYDGKSGRTDFEFETVAIYEGHPALQATLLRMLKIPLDRRALEATANAEEAASRADKAAIKATAAAARSQSESTKLRADRAVKTADAAHEFAASAATGHHFSGRAAATNLIDYSIARMHALLEEASRDLKTNQKRKRGRDAKSHQMRAFLRSGRAFLARGRAFVRRGKAFVRRGR